AKDRHRPQRHPVTREPTRRQRRGGDRDDRLGADAGDRRVRRACAPRCLPHRQAAHAGPRVGRDPAGESGRGRGRGRRRQVIPTSCDYGRAKNLKDALKAMGKSTKVIAGGHSLLPLLRFRLAQPETLVDIGQLWELKGIKRAGGGVKIGAATTYRELLESTELKALYPLIGEVTEHIGDLQVRNAGTIGGGLAHADPAADMPPVMLVLDATFVLQSKGGKRSVPARKFFKGPFTTVLKPGELLVEIRLPAPPQGAGMAYASFEQAASGYALAGAAALVAVAKGVI